MKNIYEAIAEINLNKNKWEPIPKSELANYDKEILDLIQTAYAPIGGHPNYNNAQDVHSQGAEYDVIDLDDDPDIDAVSVYKKKEGNNKFVATGHDNSKLAKSTVISHKVDLLKKPGYYIEVSGKIKDILLAKGVEPIDDEDIVRKMLKGKEIKWVGDGTYQREIAGKLFTKMMMGKPKINENKKPSIMKKSQLREMIKGEIKNSLTEQNLDEGQSFTYEAHDLQEQFELAMEDLQADETIEIKIGQNDEGMYSFDFDISAGMTETAGYGVDMGGDNPVVNAITKGAKAVGKGFQKVAKKLEPWGNAAAGAKRRE